MKFTPFGIRSQEFNRTVRGYDRDEVKAFLEKIAENVDFAYFYQMRFFIFSRISSNIFSEKFVFL